MSFPMAGRGELLRHYEVLHNVFDREPPPEEECSGEQLEVLQPMPERAIAPQDFGVR